jgi:hypothetical protein
MNMKKLCCLIPLLLGCAVSCGQDSLYDYFNNPIMFIYVAPSPKGSDTTGNGSQTKPYATIETAVNKADGIPICIAAGTYTLAHPVSLKRGQSLLGGYESATWTRAAFTGTGAPTTNQTTITIDSGYSSTGTGISNPSRTIECSGSDIGRDTVIEGLVIISHPTNYAPCALFINEGASPTIRYNTVIGSATNNISGLYGIIAFNSANPLIQSNNIDSELTTTSSAVHAIDIVSATATITGNTVLASSPSSPMPVGLYIYMGVATVSGNTINIGQGSATGTSYAIVSDDFSSRATIISNTINDTSISAAISSVVAISCNSLNTVIRDNNITLTSAATSLTAMQFNSAQNLVIANNSITLAPTIPITRSTGIELVLTQNAVIEQNVINNTASANRNYSITLSINSTSIIRRNTMITENGTVYNYGIYDNSLNANNIICSNYINTNGGTSYGIYCDDSSPQMINNTMISQGYGIYIDGGTAVAIINNIISVKGPTFPCVWETTSASDPAYFINNALLSTTYIFYDADAAPPDVTNVDTVFTLFAQHPAYAGNIQPTLTINTADGSILLFDQVNINFHGYDVSTIFPDAMTDLAANARTVPLTIGAFEY